MRMCRDLVSNNELSSICIARKTPNIINEHLGIDTFISKSNLTGIIHQLMTNSFIFDVIYNHCGLYRIEILSSQDQTPHT